MMRHLLLILLLTATIATGQVSWHDEAHDTLRIDALLQRASALADTGSKILMLAETFVDAPYVGGTLEGDSVERLVVNLDQLDCTTFVETVMALAQTAGQGRGSWRDFTYNLQNMRYRGGRIDGYPSRLHYMSDWILTNKARGVVSDATELFPRINYSIKSLDYMSRHPEQYPALKGHSEYLERLRDTESGFRNHRAPYIKAIDMAEKGTATAFHDGDMVALLTDTKGLDYSHVGFIKMVDGQPHLLHASSKEGKVTLSSLTLRDYLKRNPHLQGVRVIRLNP